MSEHELHGRFFRVLDHGFIGIVDHMGKDQAIEDFARLSRGQQGEGPRSSLRGLIRYLTRKKHLGVLECCQMRIHVRAPVFVARQLMRYRTASPNEQSGRHSELAPEVYLDGPEELQAHEVYRQRLADGTPRELARIVLPFATYTEWQFSINLKNLFHLLDQRLAPEAQSETREYAKVLAPLVQALFPLAFEAWWDYCHTAVTFSRQEQEILAQLLPKIGGIHLPETMTRNEGSDFVDKLNALKINPERQPPAFPTVEVQL